MVERLCISSDSRVPNSNHHASGSPHPPWTGGENFAVTVTASGIRNPLAASPMKNASDWIATYRLIWEGQLNSLAEHLDRLQRN